MIQLSEIRNPSDIRGLSYQECMELADDIRTKVIQTVAQNGGHLSSNLGAVEITMAFHRVFDTPNDQIVFDVGHQAYTHKLLTGRYEQFDTLRKFQGISGFPRYRESEHDCFETGHASTAISAALGLARARDNFGQKHHVVAMVGDGALTGGMCYEALNDCGNDHTKLIVILNDNEMSIARNVGALSQHLSNLRASESWNTTKKRVKSGLSKVPLVGKPLSIAIHKIKKTIKSFFVDESFFHSLGFQYLGPIDGHNLEMLEKIFEQAKRLDEPVIIHCSTKKGYGYYSAERKPEMFHGTPPFFIENGETQKHEQTLYGRLAVSKLIEMADVDPRVAVITAAMPLGTCTERFQTAHPERFYDVGIAEEHAVTLAAGMAKGGMRPYFFVYSTFLQRGYDQVMHDACMQGLPVTFLLDRAGLSNEDGKSHQGLFDISYLRHIPRMMLLSPANGKELAQMISITTELSFPCAIRYPKNAVVLGEPYDSAISFTFGKWQILRDGDNGVILAIGTMVKTALFIAKAMEEKGITLSVINASTIKPLDEACLETLIQAQKTVFTLEEHALLGGFGSAVSEWNVARQAGLEIHCFGVKDEFISHGDHQNVLQFVGLDNQTLLNNFLAYYAKEDTNE